MRNKNRPAPGTPEHAAYVAEKQRNLLRWGKDNIKEVPLADDILEDRYLFDRETTRFFAVEAKRRDHQPKIDPAAK